MNAVKTLVLALLCVATCGCGLLFVPQAKSFPAPALRTVVVTDLDTGKPLTNANVQYRLYRYENWMKPMAMWHYSADADKPDVTTGTAPADDKVTTWAGVSEGAGIYKLTAERRLGWTQVWFPWPLPFGWYLYRTHDGALTVSAPGYGVVTVSDAMGRSDQPFPKPHSEANGRLPEAHVRDGCLHLALPKE